MGDEDMSKYSQCTQRMDLFVSLGGATDSREATLQTCSFISETPSKVQIRATKNLSESLHIQLEPF